MSLVSNNCDWRSGDDWRPFKEWQRQQQSARSVSSRGWGRVLPWSSVADTGTDARLPGTHGAEAATVLLKDTTLSLVLLLNRSHVATVVTILVAAGPVTQDAHM